MKLPTYEELRKMILLMTSKNAKMNDELEKQKK